MTDLVLLTGFLGAGKTTFLNHILDEFSDSRMGLIVNEFSGTGVDGALVQQPVEGTEMIELNNGSIFCACIKDHFVNALIELSNRDLEYLFIEASGLSDPSSISSILSQIEPKTGGRYYYLGAVCLTDAVYFLRYFKLLPALKRQILYSRAVIINKIDLAEEEQIKGIEKTVQEINPQAAIYKTTYGQISLKEILAGSAVPERDAEDSTNTEASRPKTITLCTEEAISPEDLQKLIQDISPLCYRIKGFCKTTRGTQNVSVVGNICQIDSWPVDIHETQLVMISSTGIRIVSAVLKAAGIYYQNPVRLT